MPLDTDLRDRLPRPDPTDWNPDDPNPCSECTEESCEWWGICPHTPTREAPTDG